MSSEKLPEAEVALSDIDPVEHSFDNILRREDIKTLVEVPLQRACEILYDKNIKTLSSSANKKDVKTGAYIELDFDSLSPENKKIALSTGQVFERDGGSLVHISIPVDENTTVQSLQTISEELAEKFEKQPLSWAPADTLAEAREMYASPNASIEELTQEFEEIGGYYDAETGIFYASKEHYDKIKEFEKEQNTK